MNKHLFVFIILPILSSGQDQPKVCLDEGKKICYKGSWLPTFSSKYASFQGIRYAKAPINELRFMAPVSYIEKEGTYDIRKINNILYKLRNT